jgi:hypothetical protein
MPGVIILQRKTTLYPSRQKAIKSTLDSYNKGVNYFPKYASYLLKGRDHSEDLGVDGRIILKRTLWK